jgi:hypothetical protein
MASKKTSPSPSSKEACLCADGTYSKDCCNGEEINQGIGASVGQGSSVVINTNEPRTVGSSS